jgi:hypothetical protein
MRPRPRFSIAPSPPDPSTDMLELRAVILNAIDEQNARLDRIEALLRSARPPAADERQNERLAAIAESIKGRDFTSVELVAQVRIDSALKAMLDGALVESAKECGRFLRRLERQSTDGPLRLVRVGDCRDGIVWAVQVLQVSRVIPPHNPRA